MIPYKTDNEQLKAQYRTKIRELTQRARDLMEEENNKSSLERSYRKADELFAEARDIQSRLNNL